MTAGDHHIHSHIKGAHGGDFTLLWYQLFGLFALPSAASMYCC